MLAREHLSPLKIVNGPQGSESNLVSKALSYSLWFNYTRGGSHGAHYLLDYFRTKLCVLCCLLAVISCCNIAAFSHQARYPSDT